MHTYGCRVIQRAIQVFNEADRAMILEELRDHVAQCVQDQNGNHVIQKCIQHMPEHTDFIIESFRGRVREFATHAYGCRVIQCIFAHCSSRQDEVLEEIVAHLDALTTDQFGNYVVQHVLQTSQNEATVQRMTETLRPNFYWYSQHKFASNAMEKVYSRSADDERTALLRALMAPPDDAKEPNTSALMLLMRDQYGNYVVQQMVDHSNDAQKNLMVEHIHPFVHNLRRFTYGKHIVARLERSATLPLPPALPEGEEPPPMDGMIHQE
jgi:pumilio RNA-binding family